MNLFEIHINKSDSPLAKCNSIACYLTRTFRICTGMGDSESRECKRLNKKEILVRYIFKLSIRNVHSTHAAIFIEQIDMNTWENIIIEIGNMKLVSNIGNHTNHPH